MPVDETAKELLDFIVAAHKAAPKNEPFEPRELAPRIRAVGDVAFFIEVFRAGRRGALSHMMTLAFYWKDVPYEVWRQVLREVARDPIVTYDLVWTYSDLLGIDMTKMLESDPAVAAVYEPKGPKHFTYFEGKLTPQIPAVVNEWLLETCEIHDIDYIPIWRRLAAEGAPMAYDVNTLPPVPNNGLRAYVYSDEDE